MTPPAAIILAAGEGRRMGGPKALLMVDGRPLVSAHVARLREAGCRSIAVVVRPVVAEDVRAAIGDGAGVTVVPAETTSAAASLTLGLHALGSARDRAIFVTPVDLLPARVETFAALIAAVSAEGTQVATPRYRDRGGHPVIVRESLLNAFVHGYRGTLRDLIGSAEPTRRRVDVDDPAIVGDLDTPRDLAAVRAGLAPRFKAAR